MLKFAAVIPAVSPARHPTWNLGLLLVVMMISLAAAGAASAEDGLDRGHSILLQKGLQIQAQAFPMKQDVPYQVVGFNLSRWAESNFTTVNMQTNRDSVKYLGDAPGIPWGIYVDPDPAQPRGRIFQHEMPYSSNLVSIQSADEQDLSNPAVLELARASLEYLRANYPDALSFTNQYGSAHNNTVMRNYLRVAKPDMVVFDTYPFNGDVTRERRSPTNYYRDMQKYRLLGLGGHDGSGSIPIPYGLYTQSYVDPSWQTHRISDSEIRLNQFSAWAFGYTFVSAFTYNAANASNGFSSVLFSDIADANPTPQFYAMAETNRQSRNLGPTLIRLLNTDIRIVRGQYRDRFGQTANNPLPGGEGTVSQWASSAGPYITGISATNLGNKNDGLRGDVLVGYFKPLLESFDGPDFENETYFMIVNGLADPQLGADVRQRIRLTFNFGASGIDSLQRLSRETGLVELIPLISDGGSLYHLDLVLDGGVGDLFKFNTGAPFIVPEPASMSLLSLGGMILLGRRCRKTGIVGKSFCC